MDPGRGSSHERCTPLTPTNLAGCWHWCCKLSTVHAHPCEPEACEDCAEAPKSPAARNLEDRARNVAAKHPDRQKETR